LIMISTAQVRSHPEPTWDWSAARAVCLRETRRVLESTSAEDAAQEAIIRAWRRRASCPTPEQPAPWLTVIARREALRIATRRVDQPLTPRVAPTAPAVDAQIHTRIDVQRAVSRLSVEDRRLLMARYWADLTQEQAATRVGMAEGTAKVRLYRLRTQLRNTLREA
jgi:RNA polymerase sigma factor (sigma-70 family)